MKNAPATSADFDRAYRLPLTFWGDIRIPAEIKALARSANPGRSLELGCGIGRLSGFMARQGWNAIGVDFSTVAIEKARERSGQEKLAAKFLVGDVTHLDALSGQFDISYDVGCFHCLGSESQPKYVAEIFRLLKPGGIHLIWAMNSAPSDITLSPALIAKLFAPAFELQEARKSRRRLAASYWYWLIRS